MNALGEKQFWKCLLPVSIFVAIFLCLQVRYHLLFQEMETRQLFIWDMATLLECLLRPGCVASLLNGFIVQFFHIPLVGAFVAAAALTLFVFFNCPRLLSDASLSVFLPLFLLPEIFLVVDVCCMNYSFEGISTFLILSFFIWWHNCRNLTVWREAIEVTFTGLFLYYVVGDMVVCFLFTVIILDVIRKRAFIPVMISTVIIVSAIIISKRFCWPDNIGFPVFHERRFFYLAWLAFTMISAVSLVVRCFCKRGVGGICIFIFGAAAVAGAGSIIFRSCRNTRQEQLAILSFYAQTGRWDDILRYSRTADMNNYMLLNYVNLALSHKDMLLDHYSDYRHDSEQSLCIKPDYTAYGMRLLSMLHYYIGNVAGAQRMAFEANQICPCPWTLQMLVKTNMILGSYSVVEKYLSILEKTVFYRKWAIEMRTGLTIVAVDNDFELGMKKKGLPKTDGFMHQDNFFYDCMNVLDENSERSPARDYIMAYLLISRDASFLVHFVDRFYGTAALRSISPDMQYGLISATDDAEYCRRHGVSKKVIDAYLRGKFVK